ncbi:MAG: endoglucanase [Methanobrevibacter sp.]|nr:endoglucanase [Methanobrevibacter sp.]
MEKSNLIISIIIVLCIATAVAAYGIINNPNAIFSDLASMDSGSGSGGHGAGNNTTPTKNPASSGSGSSSSSGSGSGSGSSSGGSSSGGGSNSGGGSSSGPNYSSGDIRSIASSHVLESGCYVGTPSYSDGYWYVGIYNSTDDSQVDGLVISDTTGSVSRG